MISTGADRKVLPYPNEDDTQKTDLENKTDLEKTTTKNPNGFEITNYYESNKT
jgi:hypothetical protein